MKHYGLPLEHLALTKAHRSVEGEHRKAAWKVLLDHAPEREREAIVRVLGEADGLPRLPSMQAYLCLRDKRVSAPARRLFESVGDAATVSRAMASRPGRP